MPTRPRSDPKVEALRARGTLNPRPQDVTDPLFREHEFFDQRDRMQVKYEMVRRVATEGESVTEAARAFGLSRPSFYRAQSALDAAGLAGLLPHKRGPRKARKLSEEVMAFVTEALEEDGSLRAPALARRVEERFGVRVHPRTIERALRRKKKGGA